MFVSRPAFAATLLISFTPVCAFAAEQVFRCVEADGGISFQRTQCAAQGESIVVDTVQGGWTSLRAGEKSLLKSYRERDARLRQRSRKAARKNKSARKAKSGETTACWNKRKHLDAIQARLRRGYKPSQGEGLRRKRDKYAEYLEKFCPG